MHRERPEQVEESAIDEINPVEMFLIFKSNVTHGCLLIGHEISRGWGRASIFNGVRVEGGGGGILLIT